jgi:hypothetical protein
MEVKQTGITMKRSTEEQCKLTFDTAQRAQQACILYANLVRDKPREAMMSTLKGNSLLRYDLKPDGLYSRLALAPMTGYTRTYVRIMSKAHGHIVSLWDDIVTTGLSRVDGSRPDVAVQFWNRGEVAGHSACCKTARMNDKPEEGCAHRCRIKNMVDLWQKVVNKMLAAGCNSDTYKSYEVKSFATKFDNNDASKQDDVNFVDEDGSDEDDESDEDNPQDDEYYAEDDSERRELKVEVEDLAKEVKDMMNRLVKGEHGAKILPPITLPELKETKQAKVKKEVANMLLERATQRLKSFEAGFKHIVPARGGSKDWDLYLQAAQWLWWYMADSSSKIRDFIPTDPRPSETGYQSDQLILDHELFWLQQDVRSGCKPPVTDKNFLLELINGYEAQALTCENELVTAGGFDLTRTFQSTLPSGSNWRFGCGFDSRGNLVTQTNGDGRIATDTVKGRSCSFIGRQWKRNCDHSKLAWITPTNNPASEKIVCVGDLNRHGGSRHNGRWFSGNQYRGGGAICWESVPLRFTWNLMTEQRRFSCDTSSHVQQPADGMQAWAVIHDKQRHNQFNLLNSNDLALGSA